MIIVYVVITDCSLRSQTEDDQEATQNHHVDVLEETPGGTAGPWLGVAVHDVTEDVLEGLDVGVDIRQPRLPLCRPAIIVL